MPTLQETLLAPGTQPHVIADCEDLVDHEVATMSGVTGTAVRLAYKTVRAELEAYAGTLADKIEIVALNKIDAVTADELKQQKDRLKRAARKTPLLMSGVTGEGVEAALRALVEVIGEAPVSSKAKAGAQTEPSQAEPWATPSG